MNNTTTAKDRSHLIDLAHRACDAAVAVLQRAQAEAPVILSEIGRDIKLQADRDAEEAALAVLRESSYPILAEESGGQASADAFWVLDPLDGTMNFSRGIPFYAVSIAFVEREQPTLGVVHDLARNERFYGALGNGAWCNHQPIHVSGVAETGRAILATGFPLHHPLSEATLAEYLHTAKKFKKIRMLGSAALSLAYVAAGRVDAYWEEAIMFWDIAAGLALVHAAGGWSETQPLENPPFACRVRAAARTSLWNL